MSKAADDDLQAAIVEALKGDMAVSGLVGARVYDAVPDQMVHPFVELGDVQVDDDGIDCAPGACTITFVVHVWSRGIGAREAKKIAGAIRARLDRADLDLGSDWTLVDLFHVSTRTTLAEDGKTTHSTPTFRALVDPAA